MTKSQTDKPKRSSPYDGMCSHSPNYQLQFDWWQDVPLLPNQLLWRHWRVKQRERDKWEKNIWFILADSNYKWRPKAPLTKAEITLTRFSTIRPDYDGLVGSWKSLLDALVSNKILQNDSHEIIGVPTYLWEKVKRNEKRIRVQIRELPVES